MQVGLVVLLALPVLLIWFMALSLWCVNSPTLRLKGIPGVRTQLKIPVAAQVQLTIA
jgi:hypothetical protein